jgi:hypothetical protein
MVAIDANVPQFGQCRSPTKRSQEGGKPLPADSVRVHRVYARGDAEMVHLLPLRGDVPVIARAW